MAMTTPNIKALAEKLIDECNICESMNDGKLNRLPKDVKLLATALLKVLEDGERLNKALSQSRGQWIHSVNKDDALKALESHEKLMEELGGE